MIWPPWLVAYLITITGTPALLIHGIRSLISVILSTTITVGCDSDRSRQHNTGELALYRTYPTDYPHPRDSDIAYSALLVSKN